VQSGIHHTAAVAAHRASGTSPVTASALQVLHQLVAGHQSIFTVE